MRLLASSVVLLAAANVWGFQATPQRQLRRPLITTTQLGLADEINEYRRGLSVTDAKGDKQTEKTSCVFKFGGSSLANAERVDHVARLIQEQIDTQNIAPRAVVCSAMGKTTNNLLSAGEFALDGKVNVDAIRTLHTNVFDEFQLPDSTRDEVNALLEECEQMLTGVKMIQELSPKSLDQLVSYGERCSVRIMAARLNQIGVPAQAFDAWDVGVHTTSNFGDAKLLPESETAIRDAFSKIDSNVVAVVTGFIGKEHSGKITTLGRGGSDLTATALGAALKLDEIQVWKDVDGILSTDPRIVPHAVPLDQVSFEEASELAYFGAQVLHPIAMQPAMKYNVPVRVKNSYNPAAVGTIIQQDKSQKDRLVTAITYKRDITVLDIHSTQMLGAYGFLARVFSEFEKHKLSVDVLASSEVSVSLTLDKKQSLKSINCLIADLTEDNCAEITRKDSMSILTLITDIHKSSQVLATVFRVFSKENIQVEMMSQGASKVNISFILNSDLLELAIMKLHTCFFENVPSIHVLDEEMKEEREETSLRP